MAEAQSKRNRPLGQTSVTDERPPQQLAAPILTFDLSREIEQLRKEEAWRLTDHNAKTLLKGPDLRIILVAMKDQARLPEHHAPTRIAIQTLTGHLNIRLPDQTIQLPAGSMLTLGGDVTHDVEAVGESAFLLTLSWPAGRTERASAFPYGMLLP